MDYFVGTVMPWPVNFAPKDWALCNGALLQIRNFTPLFSIIGTRYGGDGVQTFALPNLINKMPMGSTTPGDTGIDSGAKTAAFTVNVVLNENNLPPHTHAATTTVNNLSTGTSISASTSISGGSPVASENALLTGTTGGVARAAAIYLPATVTPTAPVTLGGVSSTITGATVSVQTQAGTTTPPEQPAPISFPVTVDTVAPYLTTHYIICVSGIFPPFS